jgi:hypothetical protein
VEFEEISSALAAYEELQFRVRRVQYSDLHKPLYRFVHSESYKDQHVVSISLVDPVTVLVFPAAL